jgi:hypothetical protein
MVVLVSTAVVSVRKQWPLAMQSALARVDHLCVKSLRPLCSKESEEA